MAKEAVTKSENVYQATGRRKTSVARILLSSGDGKIRVNNRPIETYFIRETHRLLIVQPFNVTNTNDKSTYCI